MQFDLYFQNNHHQSPVTAYLVPGFDKASGLIHLIVHGPDHEPYHDYSASIEDMARLLRKLLHQTEQIIARDNLLGESSPLPQTENETEMKTPKQITLADLSNVDDETALTLLIERFRTSEANIYNALLSDYYKLTGHHYKNTTAADLDDASLLHSPIPTTSKLPNSQTPLPSQFQRDLAAIRPHLSMIIKDGQFVYGHQSRIAEVLGITNAGTTNRQRIKKIEDILIKKLKNSSTSTTSTAHTSTKIDSDEKQVA